MKGDEAVKIVPMQVSTPPRVENRVELLGITPSLINNEEINKKESINPGIIANINPNKNQNNSPISVRPEEGLEMKNNKKGQSESGSVGPAMTDSKLSPGQPAIVINVISGKVKEAKGLSPSVLSEDHLWVSHSVPCSRDKAAPISIVVGVDACVMRAFLDTGSRVSVLSAACLPHLQREKLQPYEGPVLESADGKPLEVKGTYPATLQFQSRTLEHPLIVVEGLVYDLLVGRDVMAELGSFHVCFEKQLVQLGGVSYPAVVGAGSFEDEEPVREVRWAETVKIPPRSACAAVHIAIAGSRYQGEVGEFTSEKQRKWLAEPSLLTVGPSGVGVVKVINPWKHPVIIKRGAPAGVFESFENNHGTIVAVVSEETKTERTEQKEEERTEQKEEKRAEQKETVKTEQKERVSKTLEELGVSLGPDIEGEPEEVKKAARELMEEFRDVFDDGVSAVPNENLPVTHEIDTEGARPIKSRIYRTSPAEAEAQLKEIDAMLARSVIEPCESQWGAPVVMVPKKDGTYRFCVDYRGINAVTKKDVYPLPRIDDCLDRLAGMKWFTVLDAKAGYWQLRVDPNSRDKTAFMTKHGLYRFIGMPFGLTNAPASFQRLMDALLAGLTWQECLVFIDDILIFAPTLPELIVRLRSVLMRLRGKIKLGGKKCQLFRRQLEYLGHDISEKGVATTGRIVEAVKKFEAPTTVKGIQSFMGLCNFYRRFVKDFGKISKPLHDLTKGQPKGSAAKVEWNSAAESAFQELKKRLTSAPILAWPDFKLPFTLYTDGSGDGLGAVLSQKFADGEKVIAYFSRLTSPTECNYSATELECLAVVQAVKEFSHYLRGSTFTLVTDHWALKWLKDLKEPSGRLGRWQLKLMELQYDIIYREGINNHVDALSRPLDPAEARRRRQGLPYAGEPPSVIVAALKEAETPTEEMPEPWPDEQRRCPTLAPYFRYLEHGELSSNPQKAKRVVAEAANMFIDEGGVLRFWESHRGGARQERECRTVVPRTFKIKVLKECHDLPIAAHFGVERTYYPSE